MSTMFLCTICDKSFSKRYNLKRHLSELHKCNYDIPKIKNNNFICTICKKDFENFCYFENHLSNYHEIKLNTEKLEFPKIDDFYKWKSSIENLENVAFIKKTSAKKLKPSDNSYVLYLQCNRSGIFKSKSKGKREIKIQGSCKVDGFCPSRIKAKVSDIGTVTVEYCTSHVGHGKDLAHIPLSLEDRQTIASKIAGQVPFDAILDNIRSNVSKESLRRIDILTRQDLYNIEKEFQLNDAVHHSNDALSVEAWVEKEKNSINNCVLMYKTQGEESNEFGKDDFCLGIMTEAQQELLSKFGSDCICMDSTHGMNAYDFEVITLMVIDDMRQGFPCAFFISNKTDRDSIAAFLNTIRNKVGILKPKAFMSDMAESFYNAWVSVMGPADKRLYCTWHVDRAWQSNLKKIKDIETQKQTYKKLRVLLEETDENAFMTMLKVIINELCSNEITKDYGEYFQKKYGGCFKSWAYCYRTNVGINTNMHLESMHRTIKHIFLKGKSVKRLDKAIHAIMQMIKQKLFDRLIVIEKGKLTTKLKQLRTRHKKSLEMSVDLVISNDESSWEIASSSSSGKTYTLRLIESKCHCRIVCTQCASCIHKFSCTCIDSCIKWNMCKHIHLLCRKLKLESPEIKEECDNECSLLQNPLIIEDNKDSEEKHIILKEVGFKRNNQKSIELLKLQLKQQFDQICKKISTSKDVRVANQTLKNLDAKLNSIKKHSIGQLKIRRNYSANKNLELQRRFQSTKNKKKNNKSIKRPSEEEAQQIALNTLLQTPPTSN